jgi:biopolymer transport protein ExbD
MYSSQNNDAEVYTVYADLFLLLFMTAVMMMGTNKIPKTLDPDGGNGPPDEPALSIYIGNDGGMFLESSRRQPIPDKDLEALLEKRKITRVVLHSNGDLPIRIWDRLLTKLESSGVKNAKYLIEETP